MSEEQNTAAKPEGAAESEEGVPEMRIEHAIQVLGKAHALEEVQLTLPQRQAIACLAAGWTVTDTAELVGVHRSTVHRWKKDPYFTAFLNQRAGCFPGAKAPARLTRAREAGRGA